LAESLRRDGRSIMTTLGLTGLSSVGFYIPFVWLPTWLSQINRPALPEGQALAAGTIALLALLVITPLSALISDRVGRRPMYLASSVGFALFTDPIFRMLTAGSFPTAVLGGLAFAAINGLFAGSMAATLVELFPTRTRYTGIALGYNVGQAILGGTAALVATTLIRLTADILAPAWYLTACAIVAGLASLAIPARHDRPLDEPSGSSEEVNASA
jgi:MHS family proline/betaine transporter-like MFS transporter